MWPLGEPPTDKELEVARILCDLEELILEDEFRRSNLSLLAGMSSWGTKRPRTLRHKPPGPLPLLPPTLPSPPYNVPTPPPPTADKGGGDGRGGLRSASPVTPLSFPRSGGDNDDAGPSAVATSGQSTHIVEDDAGSSAALPSLPENRPEHNDRVATSGQGRHTVVDDVAPSAAPPSVLGKRSEHDDALATSGQSRHIVEDHAGSSAALPSLPENRPEHDDGVATSGQGRHTVVDDVGPSAAPPVVLANRSEHDDALATSRQETHKVDGDAGPSAPPPSVPRKRSEHNDAGPRGAAPLPRGKQFKKPKRRCKELEKAAAAPAPAHHINLDLELRLGQPSPPALVHHPTLASVRPPGETSEALRWGWELQLQIQSEDRKEASRLARKRRMETRREKKMQKRARRSD